MDAFNIGARAGLAKLLGAGSRTVVLLCPPTKYAAAAVGVQIDQSGAFTGPPGRGYLLTDGQLRLGQVPDAGAS